MSDTSPPPAQVGDTDSEARVLDEGGLRQQQVSSSLCLFDITSDVLALIGFHLEEDQASLVSLVHTCREFRHLWLRVVRCFLLSVVLSLVGCCLS